MTRIRAVIVEDDSLVRGVLRRLLAAEKDISVVAECADGAGAVQTLCAERPDLLFLDVRRPGMSGFDVLESVDGDAPPVVIVVTSSALHAAHAFTSHAVDYLLKPFSRERFREALNRARLRLRERSRPPAASLEKQTRGRETTGPTLSLKSGRRFLVVRTDEIESVVASRGGTVLTTVSGSHRTRHLLKALEKKLPPGAFVRVNRSALIGVRHVAGIVRKSHGDGVVRLQSGREFSLARRWRRHWSALFQKSPRP